MQQEITMASDFGKSGMQSEFLTTEQAAELLKVVPLTVRRKIKKGIIRAAKRGKGYQIRRSDLASLMEIDTQKTYTSDQNIILNMPSVQMREWAALYLPMFRQFIQDIIARSKPAFIVLLDRKGARAIELMGLIPYGTEQITFSENAFKFKSEDSLRREVKGRTVLILDELAQFARQMAGLRLKFEEAGAEVVTACLLRRKAHADSGRLLDPKIQTCIDANDRAFAYHATMISQFIQMQGDTLDHDHTTIEFTVPSLRDKLVGILQLLTEVGELYFVAPDTDLGEIIPVTLDSPFFLKVAQLPSEWLCFDEGVVKLRLYFDLNHDILTVVPVAFPGWKIPRNSIRNTDIFVKELQSGPLNGFTYLPAGFGTLSEDLRAEYLYTLITLRLSLSLVQKFIQILRYGGIEPVNLRLKKNDLLQAFGVDAGNALYEAAERIIHQWLDSPSLFDGIMQNGGAGLRENIDESCDQSVDLVADEVLDFLRQRMKEHMDKDKNLNSSGVTFSEIFDHLIGKGRSHISKLMLSRYMDTGLDGGCIKPFTIVRVDPVDSNYIVCSRGYRLGEYGHGEDSIAYTDVQRAKTKTVGILRYVIDRFGSSEGNLDRGVVQEVMANKVLTNLLHEWGRQGFERLYMEWTPYLYGPMICFPETYGPQQAKYTLPTFGQSTSAYEVDWDDKHQVQGYKVIGEVTDLSPKALFSEAEAVYIDSLIESYSLIAKELGEGTVQPLMTLAACRDHRLTYINGNKELDLWAQASSDLATAVLTHAPSQKRGEFLYEHYLERMSNPLKQIEDKLKRYRSLKLMKSELLVLKARGPISRTIKQIADSLEVEPIFDYSRPYPLLGLQKASEIADVTTLLIRNGLSTMGLVRDKRTSKEKRTPVTGESKDISYYLKQCESLGKEVEGVAEAAKSFVKVVQDDDHQSLGERIDALVKNVYEAMYCFAPIPESERLLRTHGWSTDTELRNYLEAICHVNVGLPGAFVCLDLRGTRDMPPLLAEITKSGDPDYERLKLVDTFGRIVEGTAKEYHTVLRKFIPVNDTRMVVLADADSAIEFATSVQSRIMQTGYSSPVVGISWAAPKLVPGGALDTKSIEAISLANVSKKQKGKTLLVRRIFVTREIVDRVRDPIMRQCFSKGKELPVIQGLDYLNFDWQRYLGLREGMHT
jgi:excisionase family DNA binding protein